MSNTLRTDLYELTMAYGYWRSGRSEDQAAFHLFFRENPFDGGYAIAAGLDTVVAWLDTLQFRDEDLAYLRSEGFEPAFLEELRAMRFSCDVDAVPEGTVVFPHEPLLRVTGPIAQAQMVESALLNAINFQTLVATKASRIVAAANGDPVMEFGLRRAQGPNGALSASRASYIGGAASTSNVLAGARFGIPVSGTHAHSWVMSFPTEREAFDAYAEAMPDQCLLLVDTYDTLQGVANAIETGKKLRERGHELLGIRLDSGDLAYLSIEARRMLDDAGFPDARIAASNDLDEHAITRLKKHGAKIDLWGVGTKLATAWDQPALGGVYKLTAIRKPGGEWEPRIKISEQAIKTTTPGLLQVRRFFRGGAADGDMIFDESLDVPESPEPGDAESADLLVPVYRGGKRVYEVPPLPLARERCAAQLETLQPGIRRLDNPDRYPVNLHTALEERKSRLMLERRGVPV